ncbi:MAG TPA: type II toxin-antitoxin system RelE/ParE family toxin [Gemmatimonadales bacterium]
MAARDKPLVWLATSLEAVRAFPPEVRQVIGHELRRLQAGLVPHDWKPMPSVGTGVQELRVRVKGAYRVLYVARFEEAIYVLHAFEKRTRRTSNLDLELARRRLAALARHRADRRPS